MRNKNKSFLFIILILILLIAVIGISYAAFSYTGTGQKLNTITTGAISMEYVESTNVISMNNALPTTDATGKKLSDSGEYFDFTVKSSITGNTDINYEIAAKEENGNTFSGQNVKFYLTKVNADGSEEEAMPPKTYSEDPTGNVYTGRPSDMMSLFVGNLNQQGDTEIKYRLRLWVDENYNPQSDNGGLVYKVKVNVYGQTSDTVAEVEDTYCKDNGFNTLSDCMLVMNNHEASVETAKTNINAKGTPDFSKTATTDEGLFMAEDDDGPSYYYRGAVKNNYVSFAGYTWRIIRQNGDRSVRMIYSGKTTSDTGEATSIGKSQYNSKYWDPTYVGYKYNEKFSLHENNGTTGYVWFSNTKKYNFGTGYNFDELTKTFRLTGIIKQLTWKDNSGEIVSENLYSCLNTSCEVVYKITEYLDDTTMIVQPISYSSNSYSETISNDINSNIKNVLDDWYKNNLIDYTSYLADETFCNDRTVIDGTGYLPAPTTIYGGDNRLLANKNPSLKCVQDSDKFKLSNTIAKLDYPIALITADEVAMAGGRTYYNDSYSPNYDYYLYNGQYFWTLSPAFFHSYSSNAYLWSVSSSGSLNQWDGVNNTFGARPVINLKADVQITKGDGTALNPYVVSVD